MPYQSRSTWLGLREQVGIHLLRLGGIGRIHIIGCSRSGTTMLQYAMIAFANTIITNDETEIGYPYLRDRLKLFLRYAAVPGRHHLVTKRNWAWFRKSEVKMMISRVRAEKVGLILIVRDPRDVLTSRHAGSQQDKPWVRLTHWHESIKAGELIFRELSDYPRKIAIRFEDIVLKPNDIEQQICSLFSLKKRKGVTSVRNLRANIKAAGYAISNEMLSAMQHLRDFDDRVVHRWAKAHPGERFVMDHDRVQAKLEMFMQEWGYV